MPQLTNEIEHRMFQVPDFKIEEREDKSFVLRGHAAVFDVIAGDSWFREKVAPGAFTDSLKEDDIRSLWNHNTDIVLGRNKSGTLKLEEDNIGLAVEIFPPDNQTMRDRMDTIKRGDVSQMSFGFQVLRQSWIEEEDKLDLRVIEKVKLWEVSPVTFPFYDSTDVALNSHREWRSALTPNKQYVNTIKRRRLALRQISWR